MNVLNIVIHFKRSIIMFVMIFILTIYSIVKCLDVLDYIMLPFIYLTYLVSLYCNIWYYQIEKIEQKIESILKESSKWK